MAVLNHGCSMGLFSKASASCSQGYLMAVCIPSTTLVDFHPISADDDICAGNFNVETIWSWQMV